MLLVGTADETVVASWELNVGVPLGGTGVDDEVVTEAVPVRPG